MKNPLVVKIVILLILILFLISVLIAVGFDINKKVLRIKDLRKTIGNRSQFVKNLSVLQSDFNQFEPLKNNLSGLLVNKDKLIEFPKDLNALTSQINTVFSSSFIGEESGVDGLSWFGLTMTGDASLDNFIKLANFFENGKYFLQFDNLDVVSKDSNFRIALNGKIFYFAK